jgi:hypothetical protein
MDAVFGIKVFTRLETLLVVLRTGAGFFFIKYDGFQSLSIFSTKAAAKSSSSSSSFDVSSVDKIKSSSLIVD